MKRNYLKLAIRNLARNKDYFFINVFGLAVGMACSILVLLHIWTQANYDNFHPNNDRLYRLYIHSIMGESESNFAVTSPRFAFGLKEMVPDIEEACRIYKSDRRIMMETHDAQIIDANSVLFTDSTFFNIFGFKLLSGDPQASLINEKSIIISQRIANTFFPDGAIGKTIQVENQREWTITGVIENCPKNSHIQFDVLVSIKSIILPDSKWTSNSLYTYFRLKPSVRLNMPAPAPFQDLSVTEYKILQAFKEKAKAEIEAITGLSYEELENMGNTYQLKLQPIKRIHLFSHLSYEMSENINIQTLFILSGIAFLIILIACINYANLSTARLSSRTREIGIRKVLGSHRSDLAHQFLIESVTISFISTFVALVIVEIVFPHVDGIFFIPEATLSKSLLKIAPIILGITLITGIVAGLYPALYVSQYTPASILKQTKKLGPGGKGLRGSLVVLQFLFSILIVYSTSTIYRQLNFIQNRSIGFQKENLLVLDNAMGLVNQRESFRQHLLELSEVKNVTYSNIIPGQLIDMTNFYRADISDSQNYPMYIGYTDRAFIDTYNMKILKGQFMMDEPFNQDTVNVVINKAAAKYLNLTNPIGVHLTSMLKEMTDQVYVITGLVEDFNYESLHQKVQPVVLVPSPPDSLRFITLQLNQTPTPQIIETLRTLWNQQVSNTLFSEFSLNNSLKQLYTEERLTGKVAVAFSFFAIFIACMGLYTMMALITLYRTKEIGIRKVMGAGTRELVLLLSAETLQLVLFASFLALPLAFYISNLWLERFAYHVPLSITNYILVSFAVFGVAIFTVYRQLWRTINCDPAESLRYE